MNDYPYLRAQCRNEGLSQEETDIILNDARQDEAPDCAVFRNDHGTWISFDEIPLITRSRILQLLGE